ncbi:MAG: GIY-YIG nuclease family protein [Verrucomicrobiaceae bacterium]|nr:GIY-YIG nuclease family protein [Verrucomicrobiaceae bacterium]
MATAKKKLAKPKAKNAATPKPPPQPKVKVATKPVPKAKTKAKKAARPRPKRKSKPTPQWLLYVLECNDGTYYCGITNDLDRRVAQHNAGTAARYTRGRGPVKVLRTWPLPDRSTASKAEYAFKALSRAEKEARLKGK